MKVTLLWACSSAGRAPALQAGGHRFDPGHVHQPPENQLLKRAPFCDFSDFWNLGTITISRTLQKPFGRPKVVTQNPIYKDRVGLARPRTLVLLTPYSASRGSATRGRPFKSTSAINRITHGLCCLFAGTSGRSDGRVLHIDQLFARMQRLNTYEANKRHDENRIEFIPRTAVAIQM